MTCRGLGGGVRWLCDPLGTVSARIAERTGGALALPFVFNGTARAVVGGSDASAATTADSAIELELEPDEGVRSGLA